MRIKSLFKNITIKQANIFSVFVIFFFTMLFVGLLVEDIYQDYEKAIEQNYLVKDEIEQKQKAVKSFFVKITLVIVTLTFILFAVFLALNNIFNKLLQRDTQTFIDFFEQAAHHDQVINPNLIFFKDFKIMVGYANEMLEKIMHQKLSLKEMNLNLEYRVRQKTADLQVINENLQREKNFSQSLLNSQKEFLRYTVHETNTPLSVILTSIELYTMKHPKDRQLSKIEAAVKNIFSIYDDLSYLVKKDQIEYPKAVLDLNQYIKSRIDFFTEVAELSKIKFEYMCDAQNPHIYFNETKLQRIIDNTITNAIKYTLADEAVFISLDQTGARIRFKAESRSKIIEDTDKVFNPFYREVDNNEGFGIGLVLVRDICEQEDVKIDVESDNNKTSFSYSFKMVAE